MEEMEGRALTQYYFGRSVVARGDDARVVVAVESGTAKVDHLDGAVDGDSLDPLRGAGRARAG